VALDETVKCIMTELQGAVRDRPIELRAMVPTSLATLQADPVKLKQVLINLVGNALKFTERGSVTLAVTTDAAGRAVRIDVADTGVGIPRDRLTAIFQPFEQAEVGTARRFGGTGLGLAISASLCELMGYRLQVRSEVGVGSVFSVILAPHASQPELVPSLVAPAVAVAHAAPAEPVETSFLDEAPPTSGAAGAGDRRRGRLAHPPGPSHRGAGVPHRHRGVGRGGAAAGPRAAPGPDHAGPADAGDERLEHAARAAGGRGAAPHPGGGGERAGGESRRDLDGAASWWTSRWGAVRCWPRCAGRSPAACSARWWWTPTPPPAPAAADLLRADGVEVRMAAHPRAAMRLLDSFTPDLVLLDTPVAVPDGRELIRALHDRSRRGGVAPPVVVAAMNRREPVQIHTGAEGPGELVPAG
jgi:hypothetical protein